MGQQLHDMTKTELRAVAADREIRGRSSMTKDELVAALSSGGSPGSSSDGSESPESAGPDQVASRFDAFARLAEARAAGEVAHGPRVLTGEDRRLHVRQTIREDHQTRIASRAEDAAVKFDELADSLFSFFRGTALLFYRDMAGDDARMPTVLTLGDVHPENFGVMPNQDDVPIFGVNDFDEAYHAPFTWDLKRGAVGFLLAAEEEGGLGRGKQRRIAERFVEGYLTAMREFAAHGSDEDSQMRLDNAPPIIADLIADAMEEGRAAWLAGEHLDESGRGFRTTDELVPVSSRRGEFQEVIDRYVEEMGLEVPDRAGSLRVKDVAERKGAGTASLGLDRYYVLIEGRSGDASDDLVLELKQARRSALAGLAPPSDHATRRGDGERIAHAQEVQLVRGDVFYGSVTHGGRSYMVRERAPYRESIDLDDLGKGEWKTYAAVCGRALAQAHARNDDVGEVEGDIEPRILDSIGADDLFVDDILRFAVEAADRLREDHRLFRADHELGAFEYVDVVYR